MSAPLNNHQQLCDELYALALEENHFLKERHSPPAAALIDRKRSLLRRLDASLAALREAPRSGRLAAEEGDAVRKTMARILQILHLDRENEQLLLRCSMGVRPAAAAGSAAGSAQLRSTYR